MCPWHVTAWQVNLDEIKKDVIEKEKCVVSLGCLCCAGWWREKTIGSLIRASVNENSQFTNLNAHMCACTRRRMAEEH